MGTLQGFGVQILFLKRSSWLLCGNLIMGKGSKEKGKQQDSLKRALINKCHRKIISAEVKPQMSYKQRKNNTTGKIITVQFSTTDCQAPDYLHLKFPPSLYYLWNMKLSLLQLVYFIFILVNMKISIIIKIMRVSYIKDHLQITAGLNQSL